VSIILSAPDRYIGGYHGAVYLDEIDPLKVPVVTICTTVFNTNKFLRSAHTVHLRVLCGSENKQLLFPYTALTDWFL